MNEFIRNAKGLAKNPLGIIALFISLIYGFACFVIGIASNNLESNERLPLVWFLVIFPFIVLLAFVYLVVNHHSKLYSPLDYRDDKSFLETINKDHKIAKEYDESQFTIQKEELLPLADKGNVNKTTQIKTEILEFNDFKDKYLKIENSAIKLVENIYCSEVRRDVRIKGLMKAEFDGVILKEDEIIFIEIKYVRSLTMSDHIVNSLRDISIQLQQFSIKADIERKVTLLIFLVFEVAEVSYLFSQIDNLEQEFRRNNLNVVILKKHVSSLLPKE